MDAERLEYSLLCSKGTYVRSLARDIGEFLGSFGTLESIRRFESSPFHVEKAFELSQLESMNKVDIFKELI